MNIFLKTAIGIVEEYGIGEFVKGLTQWHEKQPDVVKRIVQSFYPVIDVEIENYVKTTKSKLDDNICADFKAVCEQTADACGFELPNLDKD